MVNRTLTIEQSWTDDANVVFELGGSILARTIPLLARSVDEIEARRLQSIHFDMSGVDLIDSRGIGALVGWHRHFSNREVDFRLIRMSEEVWKTLRICNLHNLLQIGPRTDDPAAIQRHQREALWRSHEYSSQVIAALGEGLIAVDGEGNVLFANPSAERMMGLEECEVIGQPLHKAFQITNCVYEPLKAPDSPVLAAARGETAPYHGEFMLRRKDGDKRFVDANITSIRMGHLVVGAVIGFIDISARKSAEDMIRFQSSRNKTVATLRRYLAEPEQTSALPDTLANALVKDFGFGIAWVAQLKKDRLKPVGWAGLPDEAAPGSFGHIYETPSTGVFATTWQQALGRHEGFYCPNLENIGSDFPLRDHAVESGCGSAYLCPHLSEGKLATVVAVYSPGKDSIGEERRRAVREAVDEAGLVQGYHRERAKRMAAEKRLIQEQKDQSIATLAGGIAHDFNNILMGVMGCVDMLRTQVGSNPNATRYCQTIHDSAKRMAELTNQILAYAKGGKYRPQPVNLNKLVRETLSLTHGVMRPDVALQLQLAPSLWVVEADPTQVEQVLVNLLVNSLEAMEKGGTLAISTDSAHMEAWESRHCGHMNAGDYSCVSVRDSGPGMDEETIERIFEPFFTTKFQGRGLGLSAAIGIVRNHGGSIEVQSAKGRGALFAVYLPRSKQVTSETEVTGPRRNNVPRAGQGTILLVEDEETPREVTGEMLRHAGYEVLVAERGEEALEIFKEKQESIDLVMLDLRLPGISGLETLNQLREIEPQVRALLTTGYDKLLAEAELAHNALQAGLIQKPFGYDELVAKIKDAFERFA